MRLEERLHQTRAWLDEAADRAVPDLADLDRRHRRKSRRRATFVSATVAALVGTGVVWGAASDRDAATVTIDAAAPVDGGPGAQAPELVNDPAYVLDDVPAGFEIVVPERIDPTARGAFSEEEYAELYVRFGGERTQFGHHDGPLVATIRVGVGHYDSRLREVFPEGGTPVEIGDRVFDLVVVDRESFVQTALVPIDTSERTFLVSGRDVDPATLIEIATAVDPSGTAPRVGPVPAGFVPIYAGRAEFPSLTDGTAVTYGASATGQSITITTYRGVVISCFSFAWVHPNTEITPLGGDQGVLAQLSGPPGGVGEYTALWNRDADTLLALETSGLDRDTTVVLSNLLVRDSKPAGAYRIDLPFAF